MVKANWDAETTKLFCRLCVGEITVGNRDQKNKTLSKTGWRNVQVLFGEKTNLVYEYKQLRNKWDNLKGEWLLWKSLMNETGLGFNHETGTIDASDDWWKAKIAINKGYEKMRKCPLQNLTEMEMMFSTAVATGETAFTPAAADLFPKDSMDLSEGSGDSDEVEEVIPAQPARSNGKRKNHGINSCTEATAKKPQKGKSKVGTAKSIGRNINDLCEVVRTFASTWTEPSQKNYDPARNEIEECLAMLNDLPGVEIGDELYMYGTHLFLEKNPRQMFRALPKEVKLTWLKQELEGAEAKKKH